MIVTRGEYDPVRDIAEGDLVHVHWSGDLFDEEAGIVLKVALEVRNDDHLCPSEEILIAEVLVGGKIFMFDEESITYRNDAQYFSTKFDKGLEKNTELSNFPSNIYNVKSGKIEIPFFTKSEPLEQVVLDFYNKINGFNFNTINSKELTLNVTKLMEEINNKLIEK